HRPRPRTSDPRRPAPVRSARRRPSAAIRCRPAPGGSARRNGGRARRPAPGPGARPRQPGRAPAWRAPPPRRCAARAALVPFLLGLPSTAETTALGRLRHPGTVTWLKLLAARGLLAELPLEPGDPATGVQDLLLAGVERVAVGADVGVDDAGACGRPRGEGVPA